MKKIIFILIAIAVVVTIVVNLISSEDTANNNPSVFTDETNTAVIEDTSPPVASSGAPDGWASADYGDFVVYYPPYQENPHFSISPFPPEVSVDEGEYACDAQTVSQDGVEYCVEQSEVSGGPDEERVRLTGWTEREGRIVKGETGFIFPDCAGDEQCLATQGTVKGNLSSGLIEIISTVEIR